MALRHDAQGFLQGDSIELGKIQTSLSGIRADVRAIQRALGLAARVKSQHTGGSTGPAAGPGASTRASAESTTGPAATPSSRVGTRASTARPSTDPGHTASPGGWPRTDATTGPSAATGPQTATPATPLSRDSRGRFVRREASPEGAATPGRRTDESSSNAAPGQRNARGQFTGGDGANPDGGAGDGAFRGLVGRLTDAINGNALEDADPAVKAFQEVAQPLAAGYGMLMGNREEKKKEGWFRRIYSSLAGFRKEESVFNKAANRSLKNLEDAPTAGAGDGQGGFAGLVAGITSRVLPLLGTLFMRLLLPIAAVIGAWKVGQWIGEKIYAWMDEKGINTAIFDAFDGMRAYISKGWDGAMSLWKSMGEGVSKAWDFVMGLFSSAYQGLKSLPIIGAAISMAENAATKIKDVAASATETTKQAASGAAAGVRRTASDVVAGAKQGYSGESQAGAGRGSINPPAANGGGTPLDTRSTAMKAGQWMGGVVGSVGQLFKKGSNQQRALETGANYSAGNIGGLGDAQTRALVASTALTESSGGKLGVVNEAGYMGRYQAGAGWLADAGLIKGGSKSVKEAMTKDGFTSEYKWGKSGGMTKFLQNDKNWTGGMNYQSYLGSAEVQDLAFKTNSDTAYNSLMANPNIKDKSPENIAGLLKARHIAGMGGALQVAKGGTGAVDANGTSARKYYNDVAKDQNGFMGIYSGTAAAPARAAGAPQTAYAAAPKVPTFSSPPPIADAPPVMSPLSAGSGKTQIKVTLPAKDVGQDVRERRIALTTTGGLSAN